MNENNEDFWLKSKSVIEDNKKRLVEEYNKLGVDIIKISGKNVEAKMIFLKDRFQILTHVIYEEIDISRNDEPLTLQSLRRLNAITEQIFEDFDNKISIEENVKKYYDKSE